MSARNAVNDTLTVKFNHAFARKNNIKTIRDHERSRGASTFVVNPGRCVDAKTESDFLIGSRPVARFFRARGVEACEPSNLGNVIISYNY